jgi:hypothetical protein
MNTMVSNTRVWFCARYLSFRDTFQLVFLQADTVTIRLLLAWASFFSALSLIFHPDKFKAPAYAVVANFGDEHAWALYFLIHWIGVHWRVFERSRSRPKWALAINIWGFSLWFISAVGVSWSVGNVGINTSLSLTMCVASAWSLYRTGLGRDVVSL